jgi:oxygen-independent coproporphyrinogen III oxidase
MKQLQETASSSAQPVQSLYVHVPFCARKCGYCAFFSEVAGSELIERYVGALIREMELVADDSKPRTIFFGGGTPSLLSLQHWEQIFRAMERLNLLGATEWTVECNPATVSPAKVRLLRSGGVNRLSLGVQSLNESMLNRLGRIHTRRQVFKSFDIMRQGGFGNISLDLMFAIPGQTLEIWRDTLAEALAMGSEHLSSYEVIYEEDTPLFTQLGAGEFDADEDLACAMYEELLDRAAGAGFQQYEVANFAKDKAPSSPPSTLNLPSHACQHNVNYWHGGSFYGLGPSATSYVRGVRTKNWSNTQRYCEQLEQGKRAIESREELPPLARAGETVAFGLRMTSGWRFEEFRQITGHDLRAEWSDDMDQMVKRGWGRVFPDRFQLTPQGLRFADAVAERFLR